MEDPGLRRRGVNIDPWWAWVVPLAIAGVLTCGALTESTHRGRLRTVPTVDNVLYMAKGAQLLQTLEQRGVTGLFREWTAHPPHSPYQSVMASVAFAAFGYHDVAVQALSGVLVVLGLCVVWRLGRAAGGTLTWERWALVLAAACVPVWGNAIEYFKPDICAGLLSAAGIVMLISPARRTLSRGRWMLAGLIFSGALLAKPAVFPQTLFFAGIGWLGRLVYEHMTGGRPISRGGVADTLAFGVAVLAPALPHYIVALPNELAYIHDILWGRHREQWEFHGTVLQGLLFHITGFGGQQFLGMPGWGLAVGGIVAAGVWAASRRPASLAALAAWGIALVGAFVPPAMNHFKNPQFAICFQCLIVFGSVSAIAATIRLRARRSCSNRGRIPVGSLSAAAVLVAGVAGFSWTFPRTAAEDGSLIAARTQLVERIYATIKEESSHGANSVLIAGPLGQVNHHLFNLWSIRDGVDLRTTLLRKVVPDEELTRRLSGIDVIIANEGGTGMSVDHNAAPGIDEELISRTRALPGWKSIARFEAPGTTRVFEVFRREGARQPSHAPPEEPVDAPE